MKTIVLFFFFIANISLYAQVAINTTGNNPDASAGLDVNFANKGLLIPRINLTSANDVTTIPSPATSLLVYNTGSGGLTPAGYYYWNGSQWVMLGLANHTHANLTNGAGISAFTYNGSAPATVGVVFGTTAGTVAEGNHTHTGMATGTGTTNWNTFWTSANTLGAEQFVAISRGGTGIGTTPTNGQLLIGNGTGYTLNTLAAGSGVSITNGAGTITISATGTGGTVTSISAGTPGASTAGSGLTFSPNPITSTGTIALSNTGVTAGTYGNAGANVPNITVDAQGRLTAAINRILSAADIGASPIGHTHSNLTFDNSGSGAASGSIYNGSSAFTVSYNTIGAVGGSGVATRVAFWSSTNTLSSNANLFWDNTNLRLGIGTATPGMSFDVVGVGRFGNSTNGNVSLGNDGNAYIEMRESDGAGTPYIDLSNDNTSDFDARVVLEANNQLSFLTSTNGRQLSVHSTGIALSGANKYINFNNTFDAVGYGFRDNNGTLEYKHSGGIWAPFSQPPTIPGNTEWWVRPTAASYIQPMHNVNTRVYDANQMYGFYYDGSQNQYGGYFRVTGAFSPTAAVVGFSDVAGNQTYGYLGISGISFNVGTTTVQGAAVYGLVDDPNRPAGFFRTTGSASFSANVNYSNVWIAGFNYVDNSSATFNPPSLYGQLNNTNSALGGWKMAVQGYSSRGTTAGNPGVTAGGYFTADAQNEAAIGVAGVAYSDDQTRAGGYFVSLNYAGTPQAYAYVGTTAEGGTARKIRGTNAVSEIIPTENHGRIMLTCPEAPEYWYFDYGTVELIDGKATIELDPILADIIVVNQEYPIRVFCTPVNMLYFNGVAVAKRTDRTIELVELNGGKNSGILDYQLVVKPKTGFGEGRFPQAPGPAGLKEDPPKARAKNQPDPSKIFRWPSDEEVYGYKLERPKTQTPVRSK